MIFCGRNNYSAQLINMFFKKKSKPIMSYEEFDERCDSLREELEHIFPEHRQSFLEPKFDSFSERNISLGNDKSNINLGVYLTSYNISIYIEGINIDEKDRGKGLAQKAVEIMSILFGDCELLIAMNDLSGGFWKHMKEKFPDIVFSGV